MTAVALVTCAEYPDGDDDAGLLDAAFARAGVSSRWCAWDDPAVDWDAFDVVVLRSAWDYTPRREEFLAWAGGVATLLNPFALVSWSSDKTYLRDLDAAGVPVVPTVFVEPGAALPDSLTGEWVVKPSVGAGSRGAGRFTLPDEAAAAAEHLGALHAAGRTVLVQPYQDATDTEGETAVVCLGGTVSHAARKGALLARGTVRTLEAGRDPADRGLFVQETMSAAGELTPAQTEVADRALAYLTERFGLAPAYARVDLLPGRDGPVLVEAELVEPSLFLGFAPDPAAAADRVVAAVLGVLPA